MTPIIKVIEAKKLVGISESMNLIENKTAMLWQNFMPKRHLIKNINGNHFISMQIYADEHFAAFNPTNNFTKWACVEVTDFKEIPSQMKTFILPAGTYAVFNYKGLPANAAPFFKQIFTEWIPSSNYELDNRPHFEVLGEKYNNHHPESEEEVWIPIKNK